jgi:mono/diheme cytochrome c family protein
VKGETRRPRAAAVYLGTAASAAVLLVLFLFLTRPHPLGREALPSHRPDPANGEVLFHAGSCLACHKPGKGAPAAEAGLPVGGAPFRTPVGTFFPGNLTPDAQTGIGRWSPLDFVNAMTRGLSPEGRHYFPAFPYPSYAAMRIEDVLDLRAYLATLPAVRSPTRPPSVPFVRLARRGVGLWKRLALKTQPFAPDPARGTSWNRGAYLVSAPGHCGECHTPRNWLMIPITSRRLEGGPHPAGEGTVPSLRGLVARKRYKDAADLTLALQYGETFGYDKLSSGGMAPIQTNLALLPESDVRAIAEYLVSLD